MSEKTPNRLKWQVATSEGLRTISLDLSYPQSDVVKMFSTKKKIRVDDARFLEFGRVWSMWKTIRFQIDNVDLELRFRAIHNIAGASLYRNGERIAPQARSLWTSNNVVALQALILVPILTKFVILMT